MRPLLCVTSAAIKTGTVVTTLLPIIDSDRFSNMDPNLTHGPPYPTKQWPAAVPRDRVLENVSTTSFFFFFFFLSFFLHISEPFPAT